MKNAASLFLIVTMQYLSAGFICADDREQFLEFVAEATEQYRSSINTGEYDLLTVRRTYSRLEKFRFCDREYLAEMFDTPRLLSEIECQNWQETGMFPADLKLTLIGVAGETSDYRYGLLFKDELPEDNEISNLEVLSNNADNNIIVASIYLPFVIGKSGFAADGVRLGILQVLSWQFDKKTGLWFGTFLNQSEGLEFQVYFDAKHRGIRKSIMIHDKIEIATLEMEYQESRIYRIRVFRPSMGNDSGQKGMELLETRYYGIPLKKTIDPSVFRISNYGHQEPVLPIKKNSWGYDVILWIIITTLGIFVLLFARQMKLKQSS